MSPAGSRLWESGLPGRLAALVLVPLSLVYGAFAWLHRHSWRWGPRRPRRLPCMVVSVGNLGVGGAGKTPTAAWIALGLYRRGYRVAIASRGYRRRPREPVEVVSDGRRVLGNALRCGDEPMLLAALAPGVPVLVGRRRDAVGLRAVSAFGAEILVLDDGFQHHRLHRDLDLVTVHGQAGFGNRRVLPAGPLREPACALLRAQGVGIVDGPLSAADADWLDRRAPQARRFQVERRPARLRALAGGAQVPLGSLAGRPVGLLCGLARPASFRETVEALGARIQSERFFPDHHDYRAGDLKGLADDADLWLTTEKDAGKILPGWAPGVEIQVLGLETRVEGGDSFLDWVEERLKAASGAAAANSDASSATHVPGSAA